MDLTYPAIVFELDTAIALSADVPEFREISKYPAIRRDVAPIFDERIDVDAIKAAVRESAGPLLRELTVLSVYRGEQIEKGKKSIALGLHLQDTSRTLTDHEADAIVVQVESHLVRQLSATIRDPLKR
jgi:phenylalanyl-tRNA synthetase beta chain